MNKTNILHALSLAIVGLSAIAAEELIVENPVAAGVVGVILAALNVGVRLLRKTVSAK